MADVIRVKPKKNYEWNEDQANVYMQIALPGVTTLAQVDIYLSDLILRVTNSEKKSTQFIDLCHEVDYRSSENKFVFTNGALHATLKKSEPAKMWESLVVEGISLAELKNRRRASEARYE